MCISDHAGEGTTKDWPAERGDLDLQHTYIKGSTVAAGRAESCLKITFTASLNRASVSSDRRLTLIVSYTNSTNLGAVVGLSW